MNNINNCTISLTRACKDRIEKMTSFDPSETDYSYPLYTYGQYCGGHPQYTHPPTLASQSSVESAPLSVIPGTSPGAVASVSLLLYTVCDIFIEINIHVFSSQSTTNGSQEKYSETIVFQLKSTY